MISMTVIGGEYGTEVVRYDVIPSYGVGRVRRRRRADVKHAVGRRIDVVIAIIHRDRYAMRSEGEGDVDYEKQ